MKITVFVPVLYYDSNKQLKDGSFKPSVLSSQYYGSIKQMDKYEPKRVGYIKLHTNTWPPRKRS